MLILQKVATREPPASPQPGGQSAPLELGASAGELASLEAGQQTTGERASETDGAPVSNSGTHAQAAMAQTGQQNAGSLAGQQQLLQPQAAVLKYMVMAGTAEKMLGE